MKILNKTDVLKTICKDNKKCGMYISFDEGEDWSDVIKTAPYLAEDCDQILVDCEAWLLFDDKEEMDKYYNLTVDKTDLNNYSGRVKIYALTCNSHGQLENENI